MTGGMAGAGLADPPQCSLAFLGGLECIGYHNTLELTIDLAVVLACL